MKNSLKLLLIALCLSLPAFSQSVGPISITGSQCAQISTFDQSAAVGIYISGSWSGTIQSQGSIQGQAAFNLQVSPSATLTPQSTITANGGYVAAVAGLDLFQVCGNTVTGTAVIFLNGSQAQLGGGSSGSGGGTPGGSNTNLQYNNAGAFGGFADGTAHQVLHGLRTFGAVTSLDVDSSIAPTASPALSGIPTTPTATIGTSTAQIASTAFVRAANPTNIINAANFGIVSDNAVFDASITSGQQIVTCPNSNCHFLTTASIGMPMQGGTFAAGRMLQFGTITSVDSDSQVHVSTTASATATATLMFVWGPDNTTALTNAWAASGQLCTFLYIPAGYYFTTTAQFNYAPGCGGKYQDVGGVIGAGGWNTTMIIPTSTFSYTTGGPSGSGCNGGSGSNVCFFGVQNGVYDFIDIHGMFNNSNNPAALKIFTEDNGGYFYRIAVEFYCNGCANMYGMGLANAEPLATQGAVVNAGSIGTLIETSCNMGQLILNPSFNLSAGQAYGLYVQTGGSAFSKGNFYSGQTNAVRVDATGVLHQENDEIYPGSGGTGGILNNGIHFLEHTYGYAGVGITNASGATLYIHNSDFSAASATAITNQSGGIAVDEGGNTWGAKAVSNSGAWNGLGTTATTAITAAKLVLSGGWGNTAAWTGLLGFNNVFGTITASGTGQAANPTITYTFPVAYIVAPQFCTATQVGGTQALGTFATSALTKTGATFTYSGTPIAANTINVQVACFSN